MKPQTEELFCEVLIELLRFLKRANAECDQEKLEERLAEIRSKRWGYPSSKKRRRW
jgi:hypothetical protein